MSSDTEIPNGVSGFDILLRDDFETAMDQRFKHLVPTLTTATFKKAATRQILVLADSVGKFPTENVRHTEVVVHRLPDRSACLTMTLHRIRHVVKGFRGGRRGSYYKRFDFESLSWADTIIAYPSGNTNLSARVAQSPVDDHGLNTTSQPVSSTSIEEFQMLPTVYNTRKAKTNAGRPPVKTPTIWSGHEHAKIPENSEQNSAQPELATTITNNLTLRERLHSSRPDSAPKRSRFSKRECDKLGII